jgi:hypothetical protein
MWPLVIEAAKVLGAEAVELDAASGANVETSGATSFRHGVVVEGPGVPKLFRFRFTIPGSKNALRFLDLGWSDGREEMDRDTEIAAEVFCEHLGEALDLVKSARPPEQAAPQALPRS